MPKKLLLLNKIKKFFVDLGLLEDRRPIRLDHPDLFMFNPQIDLKKYGYNTYLDLESELEWRRENYD